MASHNIHDKTVVSEREAKAFKEALLAHAKLPRNRVCADCPKTGPTWCSVNLGVFICMDCAGGHRHLGVHLSKVRSLTLDTMTGSQFRFLKAMDNVRANSFWEANMPADYVKTEANRASTLNIKYKFRKWIDTTIEEPTLDNFPNHAWFQDATQESSQPPAAPSAQPVEVASQPQPKPAALTVPVVQAAAPPAAAPAFDLLGGFDDIANAADTQPRIHHTRTPSAPEPRGAVDLLASPADGTSSSHNIGATIDSFAVMAVSSAPNLTPQQPPASAATFDPFAASHSFLNPEPVAAAPAPAVPVQAAAAAPSSWPVPAAPGVPWQAAPQPAPAPVPATAPAPAGAKLKKSAAEIAAQVQSMYQQPSNSSYGPAQVGLTPAPSSHHRAASTGMAGYPSTAAYAGQLQPPALASMQPAFKAPYAPGQPPVSQPYFNAGFPPVAPYPTSAAPLPYGAPVPLNGYATAPPQAFQYGNMNSAPSHGQPRPFQ